MLLWKFEFYFENKMLFAKANYFSHNVGALVPLSAGLAVHEQDFQSFSFTAPEPPVREGAHREFPIPKCNNNATFDLTGFQSCQVKTRNKM